jgi:hypothetical protein
MYNTITKLSILNSDISIKLNNHIIPPSMLLPILVHCRVCFRGASSGNLNIIETQYHHGEYDFSSIDQIPIKKTIDRY